MHTIKETEQIPCTQSYDALLADIFKAPPEKKPERRQEYRGNPNNDNHKFTAKTMVLLIIMVALIAGFTAYVVGTVSCKRILAEQALMLSDGTR